MTPLVPMVVLFHTQVPIMLLVPIGMVLYNVGAYGVVDTLIP